MKFTILKVNEVPMYIPSDSVGVVVVCNNKNGTVLQCVVNGISQTTALHLGNIVDVSLISLESTNTPSQFKLPDNFIENEKTETTSEGMEVIIDENIIRAPFIKDGTQSAVITVNRTKCNLRVGGITVDNILIDYSYSIVRVGDHISISLKNLKEISKPMCKRPFIGCSNKDENLQVI